MDALSAMAHCSRRTRYSLDIKADKKITTILAKAKPGRGRADAHDSESVNWMKGPCGEARPRTVKTDTKFYKKPFSTFFHKTLAKRYGAKYHKYISAGPRSLSFASDRSGRLSWLAALWPNQTGPSWDCVAALVVMNGLFLFFLLTRRRKRGREVKRRAIDGFKLYLEIAEERTWIIWPTQSQATRQAMTVELYEPVPAFKRDGARRRETWTKQFEDLLPRERLSTAVLRHWVMRFRSGKAPSIILQDHGLNPDRQRRSGRARSVNLARWVSVSGQAE